MDLKQNDQKVSMIDIDRLHTKAIGVLKDVKKSLDKRNLTYWLDHGTLLGAVRNGKLIPWDDEIDLGTYAKGFPSIKDFCKELEGKGYIAKFAHDRIKVWKKDWKIGYINIDLHLYRLVKGYYVCNYREEKKSALNIFFRYIQIAERLFSCFDYSKKVEYYRFKNIANALMSNDIEPKDWKNIQFIKGNFNRQESFTLKTFKGDIVMDPIKDSIKSRFIYSLVLHLFNILPKPFIKKIHNILDRIHKLRKNASGLMKVPDYYFREFSTINFYGLKFKIPKKNEHYLRDIYGDNWRIPYAGWKREDMGIISI